MIGGGRWLAIGLVTFAPAAAPHRVPVRRHPVDIRGLAFHPAVLEAALGDTVVWTNHDILAHTATSAGKPGWGTGSIGAGSTGRQVVRARGTFEYFCELHPGMRGTLVVR